MRKYKTCFVCGLTVSDCENPFYRFTNVLSVYKVHDVDDICDKCGRKATSFVNYYGHKKPEDIDALMSYLRTGVLVNRKFNQLMYAGYDK